MNTDGYAGPVARLWTFLSCLLAWGVAGAQGWPALERHPLPAKGGGGQSDAAVLIGIDDYPFLTPVVGAEANIRAWERWLVDGHKVPYRRVQVLVGKGVGRRNVQEAVEAAAAAVGEKGTLYLVFAGHGAPADRPGHRAEPHLLLGNTQASHLSFAETGIGIESDLETWVRPASAKGAKVVAVLDACFSGKAQGGGDLIAGAQFAALSSLAAPASITLLTAASSKDITGPLPGASRPAFSYLVLAALRGWGDDNNDGEVTAHEAVNFAAQVMREAQRPERPALSGADVSLGKSGGEAVPAYRSWLGLVAATVAPSPQRGPVVSAPILGADADIAALVAQAERFENERKAAEAAAVVDADRKRKDAERKVEAERLQALALVESQRRAEMAAAALVAAKEAETRRLVAEAQSALQPQAARDFAAIERWIASPSEAARPALAAYVRKYGAAAVNIDGVRHALNVPEVAQVQRALGGIVGIDWVRLEGGSFSMGSEGGEGDERPRRTVTVAAFHLAKTEVTVGQYRKCVDAGECEAPGSGGACNWGRADREAHPVNCVRWTDAHRFAQWAGGGARLPTEAEWEYAARSGGREQKYAWGDAVATCELAVMKDAGGNGCGVGNAAAPVCSRPAGNNAQGVCDLAGNVWEWVADGYGPYADAPTDGSARSPADDFRVLRGGGWISAAGVLRAADRAAFRLGNQFDDLGFRLCR